MDSFPVIYEKAIIVNQLHLLVQSDFLSWVFELQQVKNVKQKEIFKGVLHEELSQNEVVIKQKGWLHVYVPPKCMC